MTGKIVTVMDIVIVIVIVIIIIIIIIMIIIIIILLVITIHVARLLQPSFRRNPVQLWHVILNIRCIWIYGQPGLRNDG